MIEGKGKLLWKSSKTYEGTFKHNKMHGLGTLTMSNER